MAAMSCWPFNLSRKRSGLKRFEHAGIEGYVVSWSFTGNRSRESSLVRNPATVGFLDYGQDPYQHRRCLMLSGGEVRREKAGLAQTILSGRSTHLPRRGRYGGDLGRILGFPVRAGHAHRPQHSIPFMSIFPRGVHSPHKVTIGLPHAWQSRGHERPFQCRGSSHPIQG